MEPSLGRREKQSQRDLLAALASGFVAATALLTSIYTVYLQRQQVRAAVWPRLDGREEFENGNYKLFVANRGAGPAIVQRVRLSLDGKPARSWLDFWRQVPADITATVPGGSATMDKASSLAGTIAPGGETLFFSTNEAALLLMMELGSRINMEVCYCSSLDECWNWRSDFSGSVDEILQVANCRPDPVPFRVQTADERVDLLARIRAEVAAGVDAGASDAATRSARDGGRY